MWVFTIDGFYSAVVHRDNFDKILIRVRYRDDLVRLLDRIGMEYPIQDTKNADYPYRVIVPRKIWEMYVYTSAENISYDNFKSAVQDTGVFNNRRLDQLMDVWIIMQTRQGISRW